MWRLRWEVVNPDPNSTDPTAGVGEYVHESDRAAWEFCTKHYQDILGMPPMKWTVESEDGTVYDFATNEENAKEWYEYWPAFNPADHGDEIDKVAIFHEAFGLPIGAPMTDDLLALRMKLITEEHNELVDACYDMRAALKLGNEDMIKTAKAHLLKELEDLRYVVYGMGICFGMPMREGFSRVHSNNMSKLLDGKPLMREDGKVLKPPGYKPVDLLDLEY